ncbi:vacuolar protein-sorting-associated protein 25 [Magnaporthiopsis poae ATCC 64411]|uniref:ESCRT-II complex subunit VPS25 n=1 Tax=Magnaporthiopsis poae (strain ATCC 64411 / 73-15) TaxID=644358 RepID=A0A0C4EER0_MAGP6|nr:vacuolar protein-sorting-associated protein 25 [Magnaporthiopsis poae ATCC 64411]
MNELFYEDRAVTLYNSIQELENDTNGTLDNHNRAPPVLSLLPSSRASNHQKPAGLQRAMAPPPAPGPFAFPREYHFPPFFTRQTNLTTHHAQLTKWASLWAAMIEAWVDETAQKGTVLTLYELVEGDGTLGTEIHGMDADLLQKALQVLVKRGKAQIFGQEDSQGVKFF